MKMFLTPLSVFGVLTVSINGIKLRLTVGGLFRMYSVRGRVKGGLCHKLRYYTYTIYELTLRRMLETTFTLLFFNLVSYFWNKKGVDVEWNKRMSYLIVLQIYIYYIVILHRTGQKG